MGKHLNSRIRNDLVDAMAGVRQDCVLSLRLFCAVRQESMQQSMRTVEQHGLDLHDGMLHLLGLRFC